MKYHSVYAVVMAAVACSLLFISAMAQTPNGNPVPPPSNQDSTPPAGESEQDPTIRSNDLLPQTPSALPQSRPNDNTAPIIESDRLLQGPSLGVGQYDRSGVLSRRMVDRTRQILVLRRLLALRFSADDIATALPLLRRLNDIKAAPPVDPERALESEYEALLAARPGDPLPPSSAVKITDAARYYREEQSKIWGEMARRLGKSKADGLYNLLGQQDQASVPLSSRTAQKPRPENVLVAPDYNTQASPRLVVPADAVSGDPIEVVPPVGAARPGASQRRASNLPEVAWSDTTPLGLHDQALGPDPRNRRSATPARGQYPADPLSPTGDPRSIERGRALPDQPSDYSVLVYSSTTIRISLSELIDLMQTKLSVMSRSGRGEGALR